MRFSEKQSRFPNRTPITILVSVLAHIFVLLLFAAFFTFPQNDSSASKSPKKSLRVRVISGEPEEKKEKPIKKDEEKLQIVSAPKPEKEEEPDKASFADRYQSKVEKQSVKKGESGSPLIANHESNDKKTSLPPMVRGAQEKPTFTEKKDFVESTPERDKGARPQVKKDGVINKNKSAKNSGNQTLSSKSLFPQLSNTKSLNPLGVGGSVDYLRDVEEGSKT